MSIDIKAATAHVSHLDLSVPRRTVAVFGGANGIGEAIVIRLASLGCRVIIVGRDEKNAGRIKDRVKVMKPRGDVAEVVFVRCDLLTVAGMKEAMVQLGKLVGTRRSLDSVIMSQQGMTTGQMRMTSDGHEEGYAVQCLSRFIISHQLVESELLKPNATIISIAHTGMNLKNLSVDDLSLVGRSAKRSKLGLFMDQGLRNHNVLDSMTIELNSRFPTYQWHNTLPGMIITPTYPWSQIPFPLNWIVRITSWFIGKTREEFAPFPIYLALCDSTERSRTVKNTRLWKMTYKPSRPGAWASNVENRKALWAKLAESL